MKKPVITLMTLPLMMKMGWRVQPILMEPMLPEYGCSAEFVKALPNRGLLAVIHKNNHFSVVKLNENVEIKSVHISLSYELNASVTMPSDHEIPYVMTVAKLSTFFGSQLLDPRLRVIIRMADLWHEILNISCMLLHNCSLNSCGQKL
ncbi:hypothetical protein MRB53_032126 [Persea americana]|uniref:Uncharacterized protein n=1 Tax=Persea americana TaxID=3435 RepID=A0ACC2KS31_PERAE|nr:hypothetical protein MRB53_032126 [Persea americana]